MSTEEFEKQFSQEEFPEELLKQYEPTARLSQRPGCETFLLRHRDTGELSIAKSYAYTVFGIAEGEILRTLEHPGIPRFEGEYQGEKALFVVRGYVAGQTLEEAVKQGTLSREEVLKVMLDLCGIVSYLHMQPPPVIHRDIKPSNLVLDAKGGLWLIDFEIARRYDAESPAADTLPMCTPEYAAPEQFGYAQTDARSDIYSMGVVLLFLITGRSQVARAGEWVQDKKLLAVIQKCTQFAPKDRYASAADLMAALKAAGGKRTRFWSVAGSALLALGLLGLSFYGGMQYGAEKTMQAMAPAPIEAEAADVAVLQEDQAYEFQSPEVEKAVRWHLGKAEGEPIMASELQYVHILRFVLGKAVETDDEFYQMNQEYGEQTNPPAPVAFDTLADFAAFSHLEELKMSFCTVPDLMPLQELPGVERLILLHCAPVDLAPLDSGFQALFHVELLDSTVEDLSPLGLVANLQRVSTAGTLNNDFSFLAKKDHYDTLSIQDTDAALVMPYLEGVSIDDLRLINVTGLTVDMILALGKVPVLYACATELPLTGIEKKEGLEKLSVLYVPLVDLESLLKCPDLKEFITNREQRPQVMALPEPLPFETQFE